MKKKILIGTFLLLILITTIVFIAAAVESYNYDMDPANGVDIMEGMEAAFLIALGGLIVFYELDLFYTVDYFFIQPKTVAKSILNILSNVSLLLVFFSGRIADALSVSEETNVMIAMFLIYLALRTAYLIVSTYSAAQED